jgi:hypothetical protein
MIAIPNMEKPKNCEKCPMYSAGWGYTDDDWRSEGKRRSDEHNT